MSTTCDVGSERVLTDPVVHRGRYGVFVGYAGLYGLEQDRHIWRGLRDRQAPGDERDRHNRGHDRTPEWMLQ